MCGRVWPTHGTARILGGMNVSLTILTLLLASATISPTQPTLAAAKAACFGPHEDAAIRGTPLVDTPDDATVHGTSTVGITLTAAGALSNVWVARSSGDVSLDRAALQAAWFLRYEPEKQNCRPVSGSYLIDFTF
jgi:TonB family protein